MNSFPIFNYPTTIAWIDDDSLFLKAIVHAFGKKYNIKTFNSVHQALTFFKEYTPFLQTMNFLKGCSDHETYDTADHLPVDLNIDAFSQLRNCTERQQEISVMVMDYNMPDMTGIELCRELKSTSMKKILLTGEVTHERAVSAFNEGIIDRFIRKDSPTLITELMQYLDVLIQDYFKDSTFSLLSHLETDKQLPISDPVFAAFFERWCKENKVREYFLADKQGNFSIVDESGELSYFIVHTDQTLSTFIDVYNDSATNLDLISAVTTREKIPFFGIGKDGWQVNSAEWSSHFYEPSIIEGREKYYWKAIKNQVAV